MDESTAAGLVAGHKVLVELHLAKAPGCGRAVAEARAGAQLGEVGCRRVAEARKVRKAAKRRARESAVAAAVRESLTTAQVPLAAPGTGAAPDGRGGGDGVSLMDALSIGRESPVLLDAG